MDGDGRPADLSLASFPIFQQDDDGSGRLIGTGFFITTNGLFVTARHVLEAVLDAQGDQRYPILLMQFLPGNRCLYRPILRCATHPFADVGVGVAAEMLDPSGIPLTNNILTLTTEPVPVGAHVATYAYPRHSNLSRNGLRVLNLMPAYYDGYIEEYFPNGRDRIMMPAPCYQTNIVIHGGASGGPVFTPRSGCVFGVNSTGFDGANVSYISRVNEILPLRLDDVSIGDAPPRCMRISDIAETGNVVVNKPGLLNPSSTCPLPA